jgi:mono/diheme cytochrome c family protein
VNPFFCSRGRRPRPSLSKSVAGVSDPGPRLPAAATILAYRNGYAAHIVSAIIITLLIVSCANFASPPEVSPVLIANARPDHASAQELAAGRNLFASRCLECHTLPRVTKYNREQWPHLVSRMSGRANLSASDQSAIIAYLRAASLSPH